MQVSITCRHGSIEDETHEHIVRKAEKLLHYFERVTEINVTVSFEGDRTAVEILVDAEHKHNFVARAEGQQVQTVFDGALQKMEQQIRRYKEKLQDHRRDRPMNHLADPEQAGEREGE